MQSRPKVVSFWIISWTLWCRIMTVVEKFRGQNSFKTRTYREINMELSNHQVYNAKEYINERGRINFTRFRLRDHLRSSKDRNKEVGKNQGSGSCLWLWRWYPGWRHALLKYTITAGERRKFGVQDGVYDNIGMMMKEMFEHLCHVCITAQIILSNPSRELCHWNIGNCWRC